MHSKRSSMQRKDLVTNRATNELLRRKPFEGLGEESNNRIRRIPYEDTEGLLQAD